MNGSSLMFFYHYLTVRQWNLDFIKTKDLTRRRFVCMHMEIDHDQPVVGRAWFRNH
uniref:Uncharacterized protein n=1 Tax=Cajanus cajan TaxID=3821 RepID=A0A151QYX6_CAJCA|nr:hypothetical protein KK1_043457 [Cajanus cajan]